MTEKKTGTEKKPPQGKEVGLENVTEQVEVANRLCGDFIEEIWTAFQDFVGELLSDSTRLENLIDAICDENDKDAMDKTADFASDFIRSHIALIRKYRRLKESS